MKILAVCSLMGSFGAVVAMDRVAAQTAPATGTQLITLGTAGGPLPRANRAQSSNLLVVNGALYLIDAGGSVTSRVVQSAHDFRKIGKIFITHPHSDHTAGLATLMVSQWEYQRAEPTDIYGGGVESLVKGALAYLAPNAEIRWAEGKKRPMADTFKGHDIEAGIIYQDANIKVTGGREHSLPIRARHAALRQVQIVLLPLRYTGPFVFVHRRHRLVRCGH